MLLRLNLLLAGFLLGISLYSQNMNLVGHVDYQALHGSQLSNCWGYVDETGKEYALVGARKGTSILDISDPTHPVEVFWEPGTESVWREIKTYGDVMYVTTEAGDGLLIVDLSPLPGGLPVAQSPHYYGGIPVDTRWTSAHTLSIDEFGYAYIQGANRGNGGVIILDIHTDPLNPVEVGTFDPWYCHDSYTHNNLFFGAHISTGIMSIVDMTDRANPVLLNTKATPDNFTHNVWATSDNSYVVTTDERSNAYITLYDVSDPLDIEELDRIQSSPGFNIIPHNAYILHDSLIVASYYTDGVVMIDMTRPHNMVLIGAYDTNPLHDGTFNGSWGTYPFLPSGLILASDITEGLFIIQPEINKAAYFEGLVRDASTLSPIGDVLVTIKDNPHTDESDVHGKFAVGTVTTGPQEVTFSKVAYYPKKVTVDFSSGQVVVDTIDLVSLPPFSLNLIVTDAATGVGIIDANIRIEVPEMIVNSTTNGIGTQDFTLYYPGLTTITVGKWGYRTNCSDYTIDPSTGTITVQLTKGIYDDFAFDFGWITANNGAQSGLWERGIPNGSDNPNTPYFDAAYDCDHYAFVTGNAVSTSSDFDDVDNGQVTLYSPQFDLTHEPDPYIHYSRWFYCDYGPMPPPDDTLKIYLSNGAKTLLVDQALPNYVDYGKWVSRSIHVSDFMTPTANMQLKVRVSDYYPTINITEAGLDRFFVANENQVDVAENMGRVFTIFPNPVSSELEVSGVKERTNFRITDMAGKQLKTGAFSPDQPQLDCSDIERGIYILQIENQTIRFIKD